MYILIKELLTMLAKLFDIISKSKEYEYTYLNYQIMFNISEPEWVWKISYALLLAAIAGCDTEPSLTTSQWLQLL